MRLTSPTMCGRVGNANWYMCLAKEEGSKSKEKLNSTIDLQKRSYDSGTDSDFVTLGVGGNEVPKLEATSENVNLTPFCVSVPDPLRIITIPVAQGCCRVYRLMFVTQLSSDGRCYGNAIIITMKHARGTEKAGYP